MAMPFEKAMAFEKLVTDQVSQAVRNLGYKTTSEAESSRSSSRAFHWLRDRGFRPDIFVEGPRRGVIVETKIRPVMMYDVFQMYEARTRSGEDMGALICVPDSEFGRITESVKSYAEELGVYLCPVSEVSDAMSKLLK